MIESSPKTIGKPRYFNTISSTTPVLKLKLLKPIPQTSASRAFDYKLWFKLENSIKSIFNSEPLKHGLQDLHNYVKTLCRTNNSKELYEHLKKLCESHIQTLKLTEEQLACTTWLNLGYFWAQNLIVNDSEL